MRTKIYLLLIALAATVGSVLGQNFEVDGLWYRGLTSNKVTVVMPDTVKYSKYSGNVIIPATIILEGVTYDVTEIERSAFVNCINLTGITLGDKLERINSQAFNRCVNLKTITIPKSVTVINPSFVDNCTALESIIVDADNTVYMNNDGIVYTKIAPISLVKYPAGKQESTFVIPSFVEELASFSFHSCVNLQSITIPNTLTTVSDGAFRYAQFQSIIVESGHGSYIDIDGVLFSKDEKTLVQYPIGRVTPDVYNAPESVENLGASAFTGSSLREIHLPNKITALSSSIFRLCVSLETITGLENVVTLGSQVFDGCRSLKNIELSENLISIGNQAFRDCDNLFSGNVEIPKTVTTIGNAAFSGCLGIESFSIEGGNNTSLSTDESGALFSTSPKRLIQYPPANKQESYSLPDDIVVIDRQAFQGAKIGELTLSEDLTTINANAFDGSDIDVIIFNSDTPPTTLGNSAFYGVSGDIVVMTSSKDPAVIADYQDKLGAFGFDISEYAMILDYNDGLTTVRVLGSDPATKKMRVEPETPSRSGYDFVGWYDEAGDKWVAGTVVSSNIVLAAQWRVTPPPPTQYSVTLESLSGVGLSREAKTYPVNENSAFSFGATATDVNYAVIVYVNGNILIPSSDNFYMIDGIKEDLSITFRLTLASKVDDNNTGGDKVVIDENTPSDIDGDYPPTGEIIIYPPVVDPNNPGTVTLDGEEVEGEWKTDENGAPIYVIDYENLEDGKHTLVINDKEYTFTTNSGNKTSNDVLSTAKVSVLVGAITIETPKVVSVQVVSFAGQVVYSAKVIGSATVNVPSGIYAVVVDGAATKVVIR